MMTLAAFATLCEAYLHIWPSIELFRWLLYFKTHTEDSILVTCGAATFYVKNPKKGVDHINLPPFKVGGPGERDSWSASLPNPGPDMVKILQRIVTLEAEGNLKPSDLLLAFLDARVLPL
jgi:hypothetical protein